MDFIPSSLKYISCHYAIKMIMIQFDFALGMYEPEKRTESDSVVVLMSCLVVSCEKSLKILFYPA